MVAWPADVGHQVLAELLAGALTQAVENVLELGAIDDDGLSLGTARGAKGSSALEQGKLADEEGSGASGSQDDEPKGTSASLPPPMVPGNADRPTSLCAMQVS
jgi:hypothetical protein